MRALVAREGLRDSIQLDSAGTGAWHVGSAPDERATARARSRGRRAGGRGAPGAPGGLRGLRPAAGDGRRERARAAAPGAGRGAAREGAAAARVRPGERGADGTWTCRTRTTAARAASTRCSSWCRRPARACSSRSPAGVTRRTRTRRARARRRRALTDAGATLPPGAREVTRVGGGDINEAFRVVLEDGRDGVREDARGRGRGRVRGGGGGPALAG